MIYTGTSESKTIEVGPMLASRGRVGREPRAGGGEPDALTRIHFGGTGNMVNHQQSMATLSCIAEIKHSVHGVYVLSARMCRVTKEAAMDLLGELEPAKDTL